MIKRRYIVYGVNNKGEFLRGTCIDYDMIHCIKVCEEKNIKIRKIEQFNFEEADLPMGIEKMEKINFQR